MEREDGNIGTMSYLTLQRGMALSHSIEDYPEGIVVVVDKPYRWTSADVIRKVKWMAIKHFHKKNLKVGHAGTLDPLATGVLLVCIGKATKLAESFQKAPKQYIAGVTFGATTASYDLEKEADQFWSVDRVSEESLRAVLPSFVGEQDQVAPLFSAKSVDGVRVYEIARKRYKAGLPVEDLGILNASRITIYSMELLDYSNGAKVYPPRGVPPTASLVGGAQPTVGRDDGAAVTGSEGTPWHRFPNQRIHVAQIPEGLPQADILVDCSKGTYIRAIARDLGEALGSGAFLHSLRRTRNAGFSIDDALGIEDLSLLFGTWV